jgi:hypothetical protein
VLQMLAVGTTFLFPDEVSQFLYLLLRSHFAPRNSLP